MVRKLIGNRVAEKDIRDWLQQQQFFGDSARFAEIELHALKRPGWLQIFRFQVEAKSKHGEWLTLFGVLRDDDRYNRVDIEAFPDRASQQITLAKWSEGCIQPRSQRVKQDSSAGENWWGFGLLLALAVLLVAVLGVRWMMGN